MMNRGTSRIVTSALALAIISTTLMSTEGGQQLLGEEAEAHVKFASGRWVFRGKTIDSSGNRFDRKDPINIIFKGHGLEYTEPNIETHIYNHTSWLGAGPGPCSRQQRVVWTKPTTRDTTSDKDDYQRDNRVTGMCLGARWHLRGWDDQEHDQYTGTHGRQNQWSVVGVHRENNLHNINLDWDMARRKFTRKMGGHCSWPKWKRHTQARDPDIQGFDNSGWIGRISLKHSPDC